MIRLDNNNFVSFTKEILSEVRNKGKTAALGHAIVSVSMVNTLNHFSGIIPLRCGIHPTRLYMYRSHSKKIANHFSLPSIFCTDINIFMIQANFQSN